MYNLCKTANLKISVCPWLETRRVSLTCHILRWLCTMRMWAWISRPLPILIIFFWCYICLVSKTCVILSRLSWLARVFLLFLCWGLLDGVAVLPDMWPALPPWSLFFLSWKRTAPLALISICSHVPLFKCNPYLCASVSSKCICISISLHVCQKRIVVCMKDFCKKERVYEQSCLASIPPAQMEHF